MAPATVQNPYLDGQAYLDCSQDTSALVDKEVQSILSREYETAKKLLTDNRELLDEISLYLLNKETITGEEMMAFINAAKEEKNLPADDNSPSAEESDFAE